MANDGKLSTNLPVGLRGLRAYYHVDRGESGAAGAAGLGLAITRRIVELHAGEISVENVEGQGATFIIRLPAAVPI